MQIDFSGYNYFPSLLCNYSEHAAYSELSVDDKDAIVPIFELSRINHARDLEESGDMIRATVANRPFILDLDKRSAPDPYVARQPVNPDEDRRRVEHETAAQNSYNQVVADLLDPNNGFENWRMFVENYPTCVPVLQFSDPASEQREILRQAAQLGAADQSIAIRLRRTNDGNLAELILQALAVLPNQRQLLVILDCGQGRSRLDDKSSFAIDLIDAVVGDLPLSRRSSLRVVCMSNSFPALQHDGIREVTNLDWDVWRTVREQHRVAFGDYAAVPRPGALSSFRPFEWRATVVLAQHERWLAYRHPFARDAAGWVDGSRAIGEAVDGGVPGDCWGNRLIQRGINDEIADVSSARFWHAAKSNSHIHAQIAFADHIVEEYGLDDSPN